MAYAMELKDITKTFPGVMALDKMSFQIKAGEVHAICGENGAGKSTLMKVCTGVYQADSGEILLDGKKVEFRNPNEAYASGLAIMYQETSLFEKMTVLENMFVGHEPRKKSGIFKVIDYAAERAQATKILELLESDLDLNQRISELGMAKKQMVEIAKALTFNAKILILDEPTASLTQREVDALFDVIRKLKKQNIAIVYISHRLEEIFSICDRVTVIRDGKYISTNNVSETNKDRLVADMVGRDIGAYYPKEQIQLGGEVFRVEHLKQTGLVNDVSLHVNKGEIVGISGLDGAGRTEFALAACGFTPPDSGKVMVDGKQIPLHSVTKSMDAGLVYVSEDRGKCGLVLDMSLNDNISLPQLRKFSHNMFVDRAKCRAVSKEAIKQFDIKAPSEDFVVTNLSGGNQQKVSVAKGIALHPKIIILDEPTRGVDVNAKAEIYSIITDLAKKELGVLMISSEMPELLGMCDRIYVMRDGLICGELTREEATKEKILKLALNV
jgi:ABC-type sugar transport system ATPase subunit